MEPLNVFNDTAVMKTAQKVADYYDMPNKLPSYCTRAYQDNPRIVMTAHDDPSLQMRELDPKYESMVNDIWYALEKEFPAEEDTYTVKKSLIAHDFSGLSTIMGKHWSHPGLFPINNKHLARPKRMTDKERRTLQIICEEFFSGYTSAAASIKRDSSNGIVFHTPDLFLKKKAISNFFENVDDIRDAASVSDMSGLADLGVLNWFMLGSRLQPDSCEFEFRGKVPHIKHKKRTVNYGNKVVVPDRTVPGYEDSRQSSRLRIIFGGSATLNLPFAILATPIIKYALTGNHILSEMIHHTTDWEDKIKDFDHFVGMDFSQFDMTISNDIIQVIFEEFDKALPERFAFSRLLIPNAPVLAPFPVVASREEQSKIEPSLLANRHPMSYDPTDGNYSLGNQSGQFLVATVAKIAALFQTCLILQKIGLVKDVRKDFFSKDQFFVLNSGDDTLVAFKDKKHADHFEDIISSPREDNDLFFNISVEKPIVFLGRILAEVDGKLMFLPDLTSYPVRFLRREDHWFKKTFPRFGYFERKSYYALHPSFERMDALMNSYVKKHYGRTLDCIVGGAEDMDTQLTANYHNLVFMETDGDSIYYKQDPSDVDPEVLAEKFLTYPKELVDGLFGLPNPHNGKRPSYGKMVLSAAAGF